MKAFLLPLFLAMRVYCSDAPETDAKSFSSERPFAGKPAPSLAFDNNKNPVYYASVFGGKISVFNISDGSEFVSFESTGQAPLFLDFSASNDAVNVSFANGGIISCGIYAKACSSLYTPAEEPIFSAFLPIADQFILQFPSGRLDFIEVSSRRPVFSAELHSPITAFSLDREKKNFIAGLEDGSALVWSVMGRGSLARTAPASRAKIIFVKDFSYSELPPGGVETVRDPGKVPQKSGIVALDSAGTFHLFSMPKKGDKPILKPLSEFKSGLDASYKPVCGASSADYLVFSNPYGKLRFFNFRYASLSYEDKEFAEMTSGLPLSPESSRVKIRFTLPELEEKGNENLSLDEPSLLALSPDGKYFLSGGESGKIILNKNPLTARRFAVMAEKADSAAAAGKYDLAITLYSQALGIYADESVEKKREDAWELKRSAEREKLEKIEKMRCVKKK
jgi:WD40 repeat protein